MKKKIIPRRDHEVYYLSPPDDIKEKQLRPYVMEQLNRLHPAFTASTVFDYRLFVFNKVRWIMVTVMEEGTFAEYRILYKGAALYTNTSIAACNKDFVNGGIKTIDDESIGYDSIKNCPVSLPLEPEKPGEDQELAGRLKSIPARHGVFLKRIPKKIFLIVAAAVVTIFSLFSIYYLLLKNKAVPLPIMEIQPEPLPEIKYMPNAIEILAKVSCDIVEAKGEIVRFQYNEEIESVLVIQLRSIDVSKAHEIFSDYEYIFLQDIQNVSYINGDPYITINVKIVEKDYALLASTNFPEQSSFIPVIIELNNAFRQNGITIISETLPTSSNNYYIITYTANDRELVSSLEFFTSLCEKYPLKMSNMDITINDEKQRFTVVNTLSHSDNETVEQFVPELKHSTIPLAFGYKNPPAPEIRPVNRVPVPVMETEKEPEPKVITVQPRPNAIGTISGGGKRVEFYHDPVDGKLKMREIND